jgi:hypothetical protein
MLIVAEVVAGPAFGQILGVGQFNIIQVAIVRELDLPRVVAVDQAEMDGVAVVSGIKQDQRIVAGLIAADVLIDAGKPVVARIVEAAHRPDI